MIGDILQPTHLLLILVVALVVLGPKRLPEVGRAVGRSIHDFKGAVNGEHHDETEQVLGEAATPAQRAGRQRRLTRQLQPRAMPVQWGILSTARINDKFLAGCAQSDAATSARSPAATPSARVRTPTSTGSSARTAATRRCSPTRRSRRSTSRCPNSMHLEWTERALRAGQARALREAAQPRSGRGGRRPSTSPSASGLLLMEAFMYRHNPQTQRLSGARRRRARSGGCG